MTETARIDGAITVNGGTAPDQYTSSFVGGGGSGGSVYISVNNLLSATGSIRSNGGHGGYNTYFGYGGYTGGGGSGGRIALTCNSSYFSPSLTWATMPMTLQAVGGYTAGSAAYGQASSGSIYWDCGAQFNRTLVRQLLTKATHDSQLHA